MARLIPGMMCRSGAGVALRLRVELGRDGMPVLECTPARTGTVSMCELKDSGRPGTWIVDLDGLATGTTYQLSIDGSAVCVRTLPTALKREGLLIALLSCYFPSNEYKENPDKILQCLRWRAGERPLEAMPHLKIFCGDQIYADVPWSVGFSSGESVMRKRYEEAWRADHLGGLLEMSANAFVPEDHEYWNSFPDQMPWLARSRGPWFDWGTVASRAAWLEQGVWNFAAGFKGGVAEERAWGRASLGDGVEVFITDTRTDRVSLDGARCLDDREGEHPTGARKQMMGAAQLAAFTEWADHVDGLGLVVLGQPLCAPETGPLTFDTNLADYAADYEAVIAALRRGIEDRGASFVLLTGDIHWGRLVHWTPRQHPPSRPHAKLVEFVSSPIARVGTKSLFARSYDVGKPVSPTLPEGDGVLLRRLLGAVEETPVFATSDNNFGVVKIMRSERGDYTAEFELWSLSTRHRAGNAWLWNLGPQCFASIDL